MGRAVCQHAGRAVARAAPEILEQRGVAPDEIRWGLPHRADRRKVAMPVRDPSLPMDRLVINPDRSGDTAAPRAPLARDEAARAGWRSAGGPVPVPAFGAGLTCGSALIRW